LRNNTIRNDSPAPPLAAFWRDPAILLVLAAFLITRAIAIHRFQIFDDAMITYRYGLNLAHGTGFIYNQGEWVLGTTTPLFGLVTALLATLGAKLDDVIPWLNTLTDILSLLLTRRLFFGADKQGFLLAVLILAALPKFARVTAGGMEMDVFTLTTLTAFALYQGNVFPIPPCPRTAIIIAAASYFIRPEGVLTVATLCAIDLLRTRRLSRPITLGIIAAAAVTPFLFLMWHSYGSFIPQSVIAKHAHTAPSHWEALRKLAAPDSLSLIVLALAIPGAILAARKNTALQIAALWLLAYCAAYFLAHPQIWPWYGFAVVFIAACLAASFLSHALLHFLPAATKFEKRPAFAGSILVVIWWLPVLLRPHPTDDVQKNIYAPIRQFCATHDLRGRSLLASDIGLIGYECPFYVIDAAGLISPEALKTPSKWALIDQRRPDYLFLNIDPASAQIMASPPFAQLYRPLARYAADGVPLQAPYPIDYKQDYVLYQAIR